MQSWSTPVSNNGRQGFAKCFDSLRHLKSLSITCIQWENHKTWAALHYDDDDGSGDEDQAYHPLYEDPAVVARIFFQTCRALENFTVLNRYFGTTFTGTRIQKNGIETVALHDDIDGSFGLETAFPYERIRWW